MKYLSLFSGIGGFEIGIEKAHVEATNRKKNRGSKKTSKNGNRKRYSQSESFDAKGRRSGKYDHRMPARQKSFTCVGYSEIDKYAIEIYQKHFPDHKNYGDITKIKGKELPDFDLLCGGFPCQSFSIAGKRKGFHDTRGTMFFEICRIIKQKQPRLLLLENVKGLLSHDEGRTFATIIRSLDELGYNVQWQVLNSKNFGVPQNRERVFIVGHLRKTSRPEVFPFTESNERNLEQIVGGGQGNRVYSTKGISVTLASQAGGRGAKTGLYSKTIRSGGRSSPHGSKQNWDSYKVNGKIRRLTPVECERLQCFPDGWTKQVSDAQRYKTLGNAVTVNVVKAVVEKLLNL